MQFKCWAGRLATTTLFAASLAGCKEHDAGTTIDAQNSCGAGQIRRHNSCVKLCSIDAHCPPEEFCSSDGTCRPQPEASPCADDTCAEESDATDPQEPVVDPEPADASTGEVDTPTEAVEPESPPEGTPSDVPDDIEAEPASSEPQDVETPPLERDEEAPEPETDNDVPAETDSPPLPDAPVEPSPVARTSERGIVATTGRASSSRFRIMSIIGQTGSEEMTGQRYRLVGGVAPIIAR